MTCKPLVLLAVVAGCNYHHELVDSFTAEIVAPAETPASSPGEVGAQITCSIADPVVAISVESHGCDPWTETIGDYTSETFSSTELRQSSTLHTAIADLATLTAEAQSAPAQLLVTARCDAGQTGFVQYPLDLGLEVSGIEAAYAVLGSARKLVPYGGGQLIAVGESSISIFDPQGTGDESQGFTVTASGTLAQLGADPEAFVDHGDIVVTEACVEAWCKADGRLVVAIPGGDFTHAVVQSLSGTFVGTIEAHRLAFYVTGVGGDSILVTDPDLASPTSVALPYAGGHASMTSGRDAAGALVFAVATPDAQLHVVHLAPSGGVTHEDLGTASLPPTGLWLSPDGSYVFYGDDPVTGTFAVRGVGATTDRFQLSSEMAALQLTSSEPPVVFLGGLMLTFDDRAHLVAYDPMGHIAWSALLPGYGARGLRLDPSGTKVIVSVGLGVLVFDATGQLAFTQPNVPFTESTTAQDETAWVADDAGRLYAAIDYGNHLEVLTISTADTSFTAPPTLCSRIDCGDGVVVDLATDAGNCGTCGRRCGDGNACVAGACQTLCGGELVDVSSDAENCGSCGTVCASGLCSAGFCAGT